MLVKQMRTKSDPRVHRTDKLLKQTFQELLGEKDFRSITVQDIVERAAVNRATFYAHFEDKFALLDYSVRETLREMFERRSPGIETFTLENLRILATTVCDFTASDRCHPGNRNLGPVLIAPRVQQFVYETLLEWFTKEEFGAAFQAVPPEQAAGVLSWMISGGRLRWLRSNRKQPSEEFVDEMMSFMAPVLHTYFGGSLAPTH